MHTEYIERSLLNTRVFTRSSDWLSDDENASPPTVTDLNLFWYSLTTPDSR